MNAHKMNKNMQKSLSQQTEYYSNTTGNPFYAPSSHYLSLPTRVTTIMISKMYSRHALCLYVIKMKSYNMQFVCICFFFFFCSLCLRNPSMLLHAVICSFLLLYSDSLCAYNTFDISILFGLFPALGCYK